MTVKNMISGGNGQAWEPDFTPPAPFDRTNLANWFIDAPWAHPVWKQYLLSLISLSDIEGAPPAIKLNPQATHEVVLWALNPAFPVSPTDRITAQDNPTMRVLVPQNFVGQFAHIDDTEARRYVANVVSLVVQQKLSPDTDFRREWFRFFPYHEYEV